MFVFVSQAPEFLNKHCHVNENAAGPVLSAIYVVPIGFNFVMGALIKKIQSQVLILTIAFLFNAFGHIILIFARGLLTALSATVTIAISYSCVGTTIFPLTGTLVSEKITGRVFGLMFAFQQLGLSIAGKTVVWELTKLSAAIFFSH